MAKVIENAQRDINIALISEVATIHGRIKIDTQSVLGAASAKWNYFPFCLNLVAEHCIGVKPYYLTLKAQQIGYHPEIVMAGRRLNDGMGSHGAVQMIKEIAFKQIGRVYLLWDLRLRKTAPIWKMHLLLTCLPSFLIMTYAWTSKIPMLMLNRHSTNMDWRLLSS